MKADKLTRITDPALPTDAQPERSTPPGGAASGEASAVVSTPHSADAFSPPLETLVARHQSAMLRYTRHLLGADPADEADAQDLVQDAFLRLHRRRAERGAEAVTEPKAWLLRVTHNLAMDAIRRRSRRKVAQIRLQQDKQTSLEANKRDEPPGIAEIDNREAAQHAIQLMKQLPDHQQRVLVLRLQDMTIRQIAHILDMTPGNVGYHLNQGMTTLARQLKQKGIV